MRWSAAAIACVTTICLAGCTQIVPFKAASPAAVFDVRSCPVSLGELRDVVAPADQGGRLLNIHPDPVRALVCRYGSTFSQGSGLRRTLAKQYDLIAAPAKELASAAARIAVGTSDGAANCPNDSGGVTVIAFGYRTAPPVDLWWRDTGCQTIDNGATEAAQVADDSFGEFQAVFARATRRM